MSTNRIDCGSGVLTAGTTQPQARRHRLHPQHLTPLAPPETAPYLAAYAQAPHSLPPSGTPQSWA